MRKIAFTSYKGGVGKSLTAANLAVCLSKLGKSSVILDFDLDAPSLNNKFRDAKHAVGKGGFIKYLFSHIDADHWPRSFPPAIETRDISATEPNDLHYYVQKLHSSFAFQHKAGSGVIHLLPSGDASTSEYWEDLFSPLFHFLMGLPDEREHGRMDQAAFLKCADLLGSLEAQFRFLEPIPEYVILDMRSGIHPLMATLLSVWAVDTVVSMFSFNEDLVEYIGYLIALSEKRREKQADGKTFQIVPVLSRIPTGAEYRGDKDLKRALKDLGRQSFEELFVLHSDRDLEMLESLYLGYGTPLENRRLTHDYVRLFAALVCPSDIPDCMTEDNIEIRKRKLGNAIALPPDLHEQDRLFMLETDRGAMINPNDGSRNVSFKVSTFQLLLKGLDDAIAQLLKERIHDDKDTKSRPLDADVSRNGQDEKSAWFERCLFAAGKECGEKFGAALSDKWTWDRQEIERDYVEYVGVEDRLRRWCSFDSDVGFGCLSLDIESMVIEGSRLRRCDILLRESFLTPAEDTHLRGMPEHAYCAWMTGYVTGVLNRILKGNIAVTHDILDEEKQRSHFGDAGARSESCVFHVSEELPG